MKPLSMLRRKDRKNKSNAAELAIPVSILDKEDSQTIEDQKSTTALRPRYLPSIPRAVRPKAPPQLVHPSDFRGSLFSNATPSSTVPEGPRLRRVQTMHDMAPNRSRLTELPTELKFLIFSYLFGTRTMALDLHGTSLSRKNFYCLGHKRRPRDNTAILRTCRRMRDDGQAFLWDHTTFVISVEVAMPSASQRQLKVSIPPSNMRHVVLRVRNTLKVPRPGSVLPLFEQLKTAELRLDSLQDVRNQSDEWVLEVSMQTLVVETQWKISCVERDCGEMAATCRLRKEDRLQPSYTASET